MTTANHTTNYYNSFIAVADDCPTPVAEVPRSKAEKPTVASMQFEMIADHPYRHTSDDVLFEVFAARTGIAEADKAAARERFFSKGQPCLRASPLGKRHGWGIHSDDEGRVAIVAVGSDDYLHLASDPNIAQLKAMRSSRA